MPYNVMVLQEKCKPADGADGGTLSADEALSSVRVRFALQTGKGGTVRCGRRELYPADATLSAVRVPIALQTGKGEAPAGKAGSKIINLF